MDRAKLAVSPLSDFCATLSFTIFLSNSLCQNANNHIWVNVELFS